MVIALLILHAFVTVAMIGLILLQKSDEAGPLGMGGGGGNNALFTARGVANILTRATSFLAALFIGNCILIGVLTNREQHAADKLLMQSSAKTPAKKVKTIAAPQASKVQDSVQGSTAEDAKTSAATPSEPTQ